MATRSSMGLILEGLRGSKAQNIINETKNYKFFTNIDKDNISRNYSKFKTEVDKFAKNMLPKMDKDMQMVFELDDREATLVFYGWKSLYNDEEEFSKVNDKKSMEKQVSSLLRACGILGKFNSVSATTYWDAKQSRGYAKKVNLQTGPYVEVVYKTDDIFDA